MKLITPSMMAIVIIVSPVLIFVLYFIFFVLLVFFYICFLFLHLYISSTFVLFSTRVVFPGWGVCFSRFGSGFFLLVMFFLVFFVFSSFFLFLLVFLVCSCGAGLWEWLFMPGCVFACEACDSGGGPCSMFWLDRLGRARQTCLERDGHDWRVFFS